jgi:hypothetical protein
MCATRFDFAIRNSNFIWIQINFQNRKVFSILRSDPGSFSFSSSNQAKLACFLFLFFVPLFHAAYSNPSMPSRPDPLHFLFVSCVSSPTAAQLLSSHASAQQTSLPNFVLPGHQPGQGPGVNPIVRATRFRPKAPTAGPCRHHDSRPHPHASSIPGPPPLGLPHNQHATNRDHLGVQPKGNRNCFPCINSPPNPSHISC